MTTAPCAPTQLPDPSGPAGAAWRPPVTGPTAAPVLQTLCSLATRMLEVPTALVVLADGPGTRTLAAAGDPTGATDVLGAQDAAHLLDAADEGWVAVPDLRLDGRFRDGPLARAGVRSCHAAPLRAADGTVTGLLCLLDRAPRRLGPEEHVVVAELAEVASSYLHLDPSPVSPQEGSGPHVTGADLRRGLAEGELVPFFQPVLSLGQDRVVAVEALARWEHPELGLLAPADFLPVAGSDDLVGALDATVLEEACQQVAVWRRTRPEVADLALSVNVSGRHLLGTRLVPLVAEALGRSGLPARALTLDLTEQALVQAGARRAAQVLAGLRALGVGVALDDHDPARCTTPALLRLPLTQVSLARRVVADLGEGEPAVTAVRALVERARGLGLTVLAKGVEHREQLLLLLDLGCTRGQGFHLQHPLTAEELELSGMLGDAARTAELWLGDGPAARAGRPG